MRSNNVACAAAKTQDDNNTSEDLAAIDANKCRVEVTIRDPPDMMSASEGEGSHGKADVVREVAWILYYISVPNADRGERVKKSEIFVDIINGSSRRMRG